MCLGKNIVRRKAVYYVRVGVPKELQATLGKEEVWKSLGTKNVREAKRLAPAELDRIYSEFDAFRRRVMPSETDLQRFVWEFYQRELEIDQSLRLAGPNSGRPDRETRALFRKDHERELRNHVADGEPVLLEWAADEIIEREGLMIERGSLQYRDLCHRLQRAQLEAHKRTQERDEGQFDGKPSDPLVALPSGSTEASEAKPGESIMEVYDHYAREKEQALKADTLDQNRKFVALFADFVGKNKPVTSITKAAVRDWKQELFKWPRKAAEIREFRGLSFRQVIKANEKLGKPTISRRSINKYINALSGYCKWLAENAYLPDNPAHLMSVPLPKGHSRVRPYTTDELVALFSSPLFSGCQSDELDHQPGKHRIADHRYWLPLIALFSGARLGEIAQLLVVDVRELDGRWVIDITTEGAPEKSLKTKGSRRLVPVHPELVKLGFIAFCRRCKERDQERLFPEIERDARGFLSGNPSRWYGRYLKRIGLKDGSAVNFHSFRHGFIDALRQAGSQDYEIQPLVGHAPSTTTSRYGRESDLNLAKRVKMIAAINYPDLDLNHLYPSTVQL